MSSAKMFLVVSALAFAGCGTLFHTNPRLQVLGPRDAEVQDMQGRRLPTYELENDEHGVYLDRHMDSVRLVYRDKTTTVGLVKWLWSGEIPNLLFLGVGNLIDDMTGTWFNYAPVLVSVDSSRVHGLEGIAATIPNMVGETHHDRALQLLLFGGPGLTFMMNGNKVFPASGSSFPDPELSFQGGFGLDFMHEFEFFYQTRSEANYPVSAGMSTSRSTVTASDFGLRYFVTPHYFVQGMFGQATVDGGYYPYYYDYYYFGNVSSNLPRLNTFNEAGAAIGWAGDVSYISLQYFSGLTDFNLYDYRGIRYHSI